MACLPPIRPLEVGYVTDRAQKVAQANLAALVPGSKHLTKPDSGHLTHHDNPQLVTDSIHEVVDAVRAGKTAPCAVTGSVIPWRLSSRCGCNGDTA